MSGPVYNTINMIIGRRGSGKTEYLKGNESLNIEGIIKLYVEKGMKVLIVDTFDHPSYQDIKIIQPQEIKLSWKKGVYRCFVRLTEIPKLLEIINENFWNGLIVFEDAFKHQRNKLSQEIMNLIGDSKQKNVDIIFMYHNWALAPKDLYRYLDYIEIFKTKDTPETRKDDMPGCYEEVNETWREVMANTNPYYHLTVDCG